MNNLKRSRFAQSAHKLGCLLTPTLTLVGVQSCSTADEIEAGRCKAFKDPKYVASAQDTDGKKWQLLVTPEVFDLKCDSAGATGNLDFTAIILDGQGFAKPALAVAGQFVGSGGIKPVPNGADTATDSCGTATFRYTWICPGEKKSTGGFFYATSGPLASKAVKISIEHIVQQDQYPPVVANPAK